MPPGAGTNVLSSAQAAEAARHNRRRRGTVGWDPYDAEVSNLVGFDSDAAFAQAVARWQREKGLSLDGKIGPTTWGRMKTDLGLTGFLKDDPGLKTKRLKPASPIVAARSWPARRRAAAAVFNRLGGLLDVLARRTNCEVESLLAVWFVESGGREHQRGNAIIRFENHHFFKHWGRQHQSAYDAHFRHGGRKGQPGASWKNHQCRVEEMDPFKAVHASQTREYAVLKLARRLAGDEPALKSISIGGPQILISNRTRLGYESARAMYDAFQAGERNQVLGFFDFCEGTTSQGLIRFLRNRNWKRFAHHYNGSGNSEHYGGLIEAAYNDARKLGP